MGLLSGGQLRTTLISVKLVKQYVNLIFPDLVSNRFSFTTFLCVQ